MLVVPVNPLRPGSPVVACSSQRSQPLHLHPSRCPFQIKLKEIFETASEIALVLELVTGGELFDRYAQPHDPHPSS